MVISTSKFPTCPSLCEGGGLGWTGVLSMSEAVTSRTRTLLSLWRLGTLSPSQSGKGAGAHCLAILLLSDTHGRGDISALSHCSFASHTSPQGWGLWNKPPASQGLTSSLTPRTSEILYQSLGKRPGRRKDQPFRCQV